MEKITKDISEIIAGEIKTINDKVRGLNFLELLKAGIIEKLLELVNRQKFPLDQLIEYQNEIKEDSRHINISISYFLNSMSISKKKIDNDSLFISLNELSNFDIFSGNKSFKSLVLNKNTGLSLPKDTVLNAKYSKNLLLIEITNIDNEQILTK
ncbi:MAG: hypothetical protein ISQ38_02720 [Alphaproteobacteria bacterium]|jgi:hypothetical protein|nr:hypothetical protein [Alphaproteobacteria bacterium]